MLTAVTMALIILNGAVNELINEFKSLRAIKETSAFCEIGETILSVIVAVLLLSYWLFLLFQQFYVYIGETNGN